MPRLRILPTQSMVPGASANAGTGGAINDLAGAVGGAIGGVARFVTARQQQQEAEQKRREHNEANVHAINTISGLSMRAMQRRQEAESKPEGMVGFTANAMKAFDEDAEREISQAPEFARETVRQNAARLRAQLQMDTTEAELGARRQKLATDYQTGLDMDRRIVIGDPSQFTDALARRRALLSSLDLSDKVRDKLENETREKLSWTAASAMVTRDPADWLTRDPAKDPVKSQMDPNELVRMDEHARALVAQVQSRAQVGRDAAVKEAVRQLDDLGEFVRSGGVVSPEYEGRMMPVFLGHPGMADAATKMVEMSRKGAGYGSQSLPRQQAALAAFVPGDPEQAKLKAHLQSITAKQEAAYKDNPWAAASEFGRAPVSAPVQVGSAEQIPQLIAERLGSIGLVETLAGGPVSPIRAEEVTKVQQLLTALPPERRGAALGDIGQMLSPGQISKLAEQIDKGDKPTALMLQAAGDRTSAGVHLAVRIGQGAQYLKDKTVKAEDQKVIGWRAEIANLIRGTLGDAAQEQQAIDAAYYVRAAMEAEGYGMEASNKTAAQMVVGTVLERGGEKTTLPRGMDEAKFNAGLRAYTPDVLRGHGKFYLRGQEVTPEWVSMRLPVMGMKRNGSGQFVPFYNGAAILLNDSATPLTLEVQ